MKKSKNITVIGDGGWGTALGLHLLRQGHKVRMWGPFAEIIDDIKQHRENRLYLPGIPLPPALEWTSAVSTAARDADLIVLAVPSKYCRTVFQKFVGFLPPNPPLLSVSKGLDPSTSQRVTELAKEFFPNPVAALSGPSLADEVARQMPTAVVIAGLPRLTQNLQTIFMGARFRVYTSEDIIGVELGGALKNVIAIAVGVGDGLGFGDNTRAALITRAVVEISRLGCALGADRETFSGLSGMGDLIVTCTSRLSRNRSLGERLGKGETLEQIVQSMKQVAEGVTTCATAQRLGRTHHVQTPIIDEVQALLSENREPLEAVNNLLGRDARPETDT